jgi:hypothetical protein
MQVQGHEFQNKHYQSCLKNVEAVRNGSNIKQGSKLGVKDGQISSKSNVLKNSS